MLGEGAVRKTENISLSNNTASRLIDMSHDVEEVLCDKLKNGYFSIQMNESTDLTNKCHVLAFIRLVNVEENFLWCKELLQTSRVIDIFNILLAYLQEKDRS